MLTKNNLNYLNFSKNSRRGKSLCLSNANLFQRICAIKSEPNICLSRIHHPPFYFLFMTRLLFIRLKESKSFGQLLSRLSIFHSVLVQSAKFWNSFLEGLYIFFGCIPLDPFTYVELAHNIEPKDRSSWFFFVLVFSRGCWDEKNKISFLGYSQKNFNGFHLEFFPRGCYDVYCFGSGLLPWTGWGRKSTEKK